MSVVRWLLLALVLAFSIEEVRSDASNHKYKSGDEVPIYANKVGPFHNPSETYRYFDLPLCLPAHLKEKPEALGEVLNGDRLVSAPYKLDFMVEKDSEIVCRKKLTKQEVSKFRILGLFRESLNIILYNKERVIEINDPNAVADVTEDKEVEVEFKRIFLLRMEWRHHLEIHWFSIINSCVTVLVLTGFLATILMRVLKKDFVKYPKYKSLFAAALPVICPVVSKLFYPYNRGALFTALVVIYALTSGIAGYTASAFYHQLEGSNWV